MRDVIISLLILVLLIGCFSLYGPMIPVDERGLGPGTDRMGGSPLVVSGPGAEVVTVTPGAGPDEATGETAGVPEETQERTAESGDGAEAREEGAEMDNLICYIVGVMTVLIGEAAAIAVVAVWKKIHNNTNT